MINYKRIYALFDNAFPLKSDCGRLCSSRCCRGDERIGMLLFPGEETPLEVMENDGRRYALCTGSCERDIRPLACRIFPFFPFVTKAGKIRAGIDYRAYGICPLAREHKNVKFDRRFVRRVAVAGKALMRDEKAAELLKEISEESEEAKALLQSFGSEVL